MEMQFSESKRKDDLLLRVAPKIERMVRADCTGLMTLARPMMRRVLMRLAAMLIMWWLQLDRDKYTAVDLVRPKDGGRPKD